MSSNATQRGGKSATGDQWKAFDRLPPTFRRILAERAFLWATTAVLYHHRRATRGFRNPQEFQTTIDAWCEWQNSHDAKQRLVMRQSGYLKARRAR